MRPVCSYDASRRTLLQLGPAALLWLLYARGALAGSVRSATLGRLLGLGKLARALRNGELEPQAWQDEVARQTAELDIERVIEVIGLDVLLASAGPLPDDRPHVMPLELLALRSVLAEARARLKLLVLMHGRAVPPHGHRGMVSMHWVLRGALHARSFDRLALTPGHVTMRPTLDRVLRPGGVDSVSDHRDNIHWLVAVDGLAVALDLYVEGLEPKGPRGRFFVDVRAAEPAGDDVLRAPLLSAHEVLRRYGRG